MFAALTAIFFLFGTGEGQIPLPVIPGNNTTEIPPNVPSETPVPEWIQTQEALQMKMTDIVKTQEVIAVIQTQAVWETTLEAFNAEQTRIAQTQAAFGTEQTPTKVPTKTPTATPVPTQTPKPTNIPTSTPTKIPTSAQTMRPTKTVISQYDYQSRYNSVKSGSPISENDFILYDMDENKYTSYLNGLYYGYRVKTARDITVGDSRAVVNMEYGKPTTSYTVSKDSFPYRFEITSSLGMFCDEYRYYIDGEKVSLYFVYDQFNLVSGIGIWRRY